MIEMFTDSDPMRSDDHKLPADGVSTSFQKAMKPSHGQQSADIDGMILNVEFVLNAIYNETVMQVCCGRPGQECCGSPDVDWPSWATETMTKLSSVREFLRAADTSHGKQSADIDGFVSYLRERYRMNVSEQKDEYLNLSGRPSHESEQVPAVPDGFREIVEAVAHIGVDFGYGNFTLSQEHIEKARELLASAPSHSQQSAHHITEREAKVIITHCRQNRFRPDREWLPTLLSRLNADRCPSHESEQVPAMPDGFGLIPMRNGKPGITDRMKVDCIGEFSWQEDAPYYDENGELHDYVATHVVPWDLCKAIYKRMASVAMLEAAQSHSHDSEQDEEWTLVCKNCGGAMCGDGFKVVVHCENVDISMMYAEPDANPIYCDIDTK